MNAPREREVTLAGLSHLEVRYFVAPSSRHPGLEILRITYAGHYRVGSQGNPDATFMCAMAQAGVAAFSPWGVIHDLSELIYEWGDLLDQVFLIGPQTDPGVEMIEKIFSSVPARALRSGVIVGPDCEGAVRSLLLGLDSNEPLSATGYVFTDPQQAWEFVDGQIV